MAKKLFIILGLIATTTLCANAASLDGTIYTDDIGRMHFMGKGNYSGVRTMQNYEMQAGAINDAVDKYSRTKEEVKKEVVETVDRTESDITSVIKEIAVERATPIIFMLGNKMNNNPILKAEVITS